MIKAIMPQHPKQELFCQKYWRKILNNHINADNNCCRPDLFDYSSHTCNVLGLNLDSTYGVRDLDLSFKVSKLSKEKFVAWRGVTNPSCFYPEGSVIANYFDKCKNIQPGEIFYMKGYPYITCSEDYAKSFISNLSKDVNILYEIEIPKGTPLPFDRNRTVLQRCSKFLCTDSRRVNDSGKIYQHIKLTLLPRDVQYDNVSQENLISKLFKKIKSRV